jgi:hypothetical protein
MTVSRHVTIKPEEIIGVCYTCKNCGSGHSIPTDKSPLMVCCPSCQKHWLLKEYTADSAEPYNSIVSGLAPMMLKRLPSVVISDAVEFTLELSPLASSSGT